MRLILLFLFSYSVSLPDIKECRALMDSSVENKVVAQQFYVRLKTVKETELPVLVGFRAMSEFLLCKHVINPFSKLSHFNKGRDLLENVIKKDSANPELRLFRLSTQSNVPALLKYNSEIALDKKMLINWLTHNKSKDTADVILHKRIKTYLLINKYCTAGEKTLIKTL